jgi:DNA-binding transcriptional regulator YhcF (GntR family)
VSGYARFHRSLVGHPAFRNDAEAMAFAYMVLRASWKPVRVRYKGKALGLNRGQLAMSVRDLADAMDRDKGWVERLLKRLKSETMIETLTETGVLVINICNYEKYQSSGDVAETPAKTLGETQARQTQDTEQVREEVKKEEPLPSGRARPAVRSADAFPRP